MFSKATASFVRQIDPEGSLIHVSRLNDSKKLDVMALVIKRNRIWFWQRPKYIPTDLTLSDLLQGDEELRPKVTEDDFVCYEEKAGEKLSGKLDTEARFVNVMVEGGGSSTLHCCFGQLKKRWLDVNELLLDSSNRRVNMRHVLVKQLEKRAEALAVVKERIFTTNMCPIVQEKTQQCSFQGVLGLVGMLGSTLKLFVKDTNIHADNDVSMEIPSGTVIAYSIMELEIKRNGCFVICLRPGKIGGIEGDSPVGTPSHISWDTVDGMRNGKKNPDSEPWDASQNGLHDLDLSSLAELPEATRRSLFQTLQETLADRGALSSLQCVLEDLCIGEEPDVADLEEVSESQRKRWSAVLDTFTEEGQEGHLKATHLLVSALEELPDQTLNLLSETRPDSLEALNALMCRLKDSSEPLSSQDISVPLQLQLEQLLSSIGGTLQRDEDRLWMKTDSQAGVVPVLLALSVQGLSLLCKPGE